MRRGDPPHRFRLDFNWMTGIAADRWLELLVRERFSVDWIYAHRAAFVTAVSLANLALSLASQVRFGRRKAVTVAAPLFVLGHWRHGTTHLHNLLSLDPAFSFPSTYEVTNPGHFLLTERILSKLLAPMLPKTRPQDAMALGFNLPQEDEYAIALDSLVSPHFAMVFPRSADRYLAHLTLQNATAADVLRWRSAILRFVHRHAIRDARPLVLKSPAHTARVPLLLDLFPGARFIHVHRDPCVVFQSMRHLIDTAGWFQYLQVEPSREKTRDERILATYAEMYDAWFEDREQIPAGRLAEIAFADLERDPVGTLQTIYSALGLPGFDTMAPRIHAAVDALSGYKKNTYPPLSPADRARVVSRWGRWFTAWGYAN